MRTGDQALVKQLNKAIVLNLIRRQGPISRAATAKVSGLNKATVSLLVDELIREGLVVELGPGESQGGRRPTLLALNGQAGVVAGLDVGVGYLGLVILDLQARVLWRRRVPVATGMGPQEVLDQAAQVLNQGLAAVPQAPLGLLGVGVGVPGLTDHQRGLLIYAPNLGWQEVPVAEMLAERLGGATVLVDNEANAGAIGELWAGGAKGATSLVYLSVGQGLGAGIVLDGEVYRGTAGVAGELGHTTIDAGGPPCSCGNRGCWEVYASERALRQAVLAALATDHGPASALAAVAPSELTAGTVAAAADAGDPVARAALERVGEYLGIGIANVINALNPDRVVVGGPLAAGGAHLLGPIQAAVARRALAYPRTRTRIALSTLGADGCAVGAGCMVLQQVFRLPVRVV